MAARPTLITATGQDRPGITAGLLEVLASPQAGGTTLLDLGQSVTEGALSLSLVLDHPPSAAIKKALFTRARKLKLELKIKPLPKAFSQAQNARAREFALTLIAPELTPAALHSLTHQLAFEGANIVSIRKLSEHKLSCLELKVTLPSHRDPSKLRRALLDMQSAGMHLDVALQAENLYRRTKRLVVFDMDSTLIQNEVIDELAREAGVYDAVARITEQAMSGAMNYDQSLKKRVEKLRGLSQAQLDSVYQRVTLTPGAEELVRFLKKLGYKIAVISGGFSFVADRLRDRLGLDFAFANRLEMENGRVAGRVSAPIVNARRKADLLEALAQQERIDLAQVIAVGDGANDLLMLERAGLGIAFNAKPLVREKASLAINQKDLRTMLFLLGFSERELRDCL